MTFDAGAIFADEFTNAIVKEAAKSGFAVDNWFWSGRQKPETSIAWWDENGPALAQRYIDWYESHDDVTVWIAPDGKPAVELELEVKFGDITVKMAIDQVLRMGTALVVIDLKSSAKAPESNRQLGIYASGIELAYGIRPKYGAYFLPREDPPFQKPVELSSPQYSIAYLAKEFALAERAIQEGIFPANPGRSCGRCSVAHACLAAGGDKARRYDPAHPSFNRSALAP